MLAEPPQPPSQLLGVGDRRLDQDGNDTGYEGVVTEELTVAIGDAQSLEGGQRRTVDVHGFKLLDRPLARPGLIRRRLCHAPHGFPYRLQPPPGPSTMHRRNGKSTRASATPESKRQAPWMPWPSSTP